MDARVTRLETIMDSVRDNMCEMKAAQRDMTRALADLSSKVQKLPTRDDLWSWKVQWLAIGLATVTFNVGGIIGGLDWIKTH